MVLWHWADYMGGGHEYWGDLKLTILTKDALCVHIEVGTVDRQHGLHTGLA